MKFIAALIFLLISINANAATCMTDRGNYFHTFYQADYYSFTDDGASLEGCLDTIILTSVEYHELILLSSSNEQFDYLITFLFTCACFYAFVKGFSNGNVRD